jgi:hypothetical protein
MGNDESHEGGKALPEVVKNMNLICEGGHKYPEGKNRNLVASVLINDIDRLIKYVEIDKRDDYFRGYSNGLVAAKSIIEHREKERKEK